MILEVETNLYDEKVIARTFSDQDTKIEFVQGKLSSVMSDAEYAEYQDGSITLVSKVSSIEQNVSGLTRQYSEMKTDYDGKYTDLESKYTSVSESVDGLSANISSVKSTADGNTTKITSLQATTDELSSSISSVQTNLEQEITDAKSEIKQTTDSISTEVSKKVGVSEVISRINQSAESVTINAAKIKLDGWTLNNDAIYNDTGTYRVGMWNSTNSNKDFLVVRVKDSEGNYTYPFFVRGDGTAYASNITLKDYVYVDGNSSSYIKIPYYIGSQTAYTEISKTGIRCEAATHSSDNNVGIQLGTYVTPGTGVKHTDIAFAAYSPYQVIAKNDYFYGVTIRQKDNDTAPRITMRKYKDSIQTQLDLCAPGIHFQYRGKEVANYTNDGFTVKNYDGSVVSTKEMVIVTE